MDIKTYDKIIDEVYEKYTTNDIGWEDRDWDVSFIYEILKSKLKKQAEFT